MGQKNSCFHESCLTGLMGSKKSQRSTTNEMVDNTMDLAFGKTEVMNDSTNTTEALTCENYLQFNSMDIPSHASFKKGISRSDRPEYQIKDGTLILARSDSEEKDLSSCVSPQLILPTSCPTEEVSEETYRHELPYIPQESPIDFLCNETDDRSSLNANSENKINSESSALPPIPPRTHDIILSPVKVICSKSNFVELKNPPEIPPRAFERY